MRLLVLLTLIPLAGCLQNATPSGDGLCRGLAPLADAHSAALQQPGVPDATLITGAKLIVGIDAGCGR